MGRVQLRSRKLLRKHQAWGVVHLFYLIEWPPTGRYEVTHTRASLEALAICDRHDVNHTVVIVTIGLEHVRRLWLSLSTRSPRLPGAHSSRRRVAEKHEVKPAVREDGVFKPMDALMCINDILARVVIVLIQVGTHSEGPERAPRAPFDITCHARHGCIVIRPMDNPHEPTSSVELTCQILRRGLAAIIVCAILRKGTGPVEVALAIDKSKYVGIQWRCKMPDETAGNLLISSTSMQTERSTTA
jgi:hypothetical protein